METPNTAELLRKIELVNRWFRLFLSTTALLSVLGLFLSLYLLLQNQKNIQEQISQAKQLNLINQHYIRCIVLIPQAQFNDKNVDACTNQNQLPQ